MTKMAKYKIGGAYSYGEHYNMTRQVDLGVVMASSKEEAYSIAKKAMEDYAKGEPYANIVDYHYVKELKKN